MSNLRFILRFGVDMKEVKPTSLLKDRVREVEGNPDFSNKDIAVTQPVVVADGSSNMIPSSGQVEPLPEFSNAPRPGSHGNVLTQYAPLHLATNSLGEDDKTAMLGLSERQLSGQGLTQVTPSQTSFSLSQLPTQIPNIGTHIVINQKLNSIGLQLPSVCGRIVPLAMERAIREIINPVTQRSVTIASQTTKELVLKDYAMESDESRIYNAAHLMVASLAGSLSHVTSKEPLRVSISNHIRSLLQAFNVIGDVLEHAVQILTHDNLDLGCAVMEQTATEKALQVIDGEIATTLASRRKKKEGSNSTYFEPGTYSQGTYALIPEALRPKPGRLSAAQQRVYEDFVKYPWHNQSSQGPSGLSAGTPGASNISISSSLPRGYGSNSGPTNTSIYSQVAPGFNTVAQQMDLMPSEEMDPTSALMSSAATHTGPIDSVLQHGVDTNSSVSTISVTTQDLHPVEASNTLKDPVTVPLPSPTPSTSERPTGGVLEPLLTTGDVLEKYQLVAQKLETLISNDARDAEIQIVIAEVPEILLRCVSRDEAALAVAQKVFKSLYENSSNHLHVHSHLAVLAAIRDVCKLVVKELTSWVIYSDEDRKFDKDITIGLIRSELLSLAEYNVHLAKLIDGGRNKAATEFAISLVQTLVVQEPGVSGSELYNLIDALAKLAMRPGSPESLQQLVDIARNPTANTGTLSGVSSTKEDKSKLARDKKVSASRSTVNREDYNVNESIGPDPSGFRDQVSHLFKEWFRISELPVSNEAACTHYVSQLQQSGLLKGDDMTDRFFRVLTELSVAHCIASEVATTGSLHVLTLQPASSLSFIAIDMYAKLVIFIIKYCAVVDQGPSKISLLPKILSVTVRVIQKDAEDKKSSFNPRPYFRLFLNWILDLTCPDPVLDNVNFQILTSFANAFHALQPLKVPGWSFAWLELISHRGFMPKLLLSNSQKGWPFVQRLLVDLFKFMEPYLRNAELGEPVQLLYKGTLRVLLVLLHDFPEFLCDYHFSFCDVIPPSCIQMRNVILSAFPRNMRLPDPSTPNLKIDLLAEISQSPRILSEVDAVLKAKQIKSEVDEYFKSRQQGSSFLTDLKLRLLLPPNEAVMAGTKYNVPLINSLVMYVGILAIQQLQSKSGSQHVSAPLEIGLAGAAVDIFQTLISDLDTEGRYLCLNAIANQLRYPNNHAHYFSFVLLFLFAEANQEIIQEQITRVLLERLIVNRPHPWGLLITFIELIKNPRYNFWNRSFTRCATEIEKLFESVSRSCGGAKSVDDSMVSTCLPDNTH